VDNNKPVTVITVLCDPKRVQRIALTYKCSRRWTELITSRSPRVAADR